MKPKLILPEGWQFNGYQLQSEIKSGSYIVNQFGLVVQVPSDNWSLNQEGKAVHCGSVGRDTYLVVSPTSWEDRFEDWLRSRIDHQRELGARGDTGACIRSRAYGDALHRHHALRQKADREK